MSQPDNKKGQRPNRYIGLGLVFGAAIGAALDNVAVGIGLGLAIGAFIDFQNRNRGDDSGDEDS